MCIRDRVAPPRLLPGAGFVDSVAAAGFGSSHGVSHADLYGALPSLHLAWATWVAVTGLTLTRRRLPRLLLAAYPILTAIVVIGTANHYVLDVAKRSTARDRGRLGQRAAPRKGHDRLHS